MLVKIVEVHKTCGLTMSARRCNCPSPHTAAKKLHNTATDQTFAETNVFVYLGNTYFKSCRSYDRKFTPYALGWNRIGKYSMGIYDHPGVSFEMKCRISQPRY